MAINQVNTGNSTLFLEAYETGYDANANWSDISWSFYIRERVDSPTTWFGGGVGANVFAIVNGANQGNLWAGSFTADYRPGGLQTVVIASGTTRFGHNPDGSSDVYLEGHIDGTGTAVGGPQNIGLFVPVSLLKVLPGTPSSVTATRVSDTQIDLSWAQSNASNGAPTNTNIQRRLNGGTWTDLIGLGAATSASVGAAANQKSEYRVASGNAAGWTGYSASGAVYTTPAAPTGALAAKNTGLDIIVSFTPNVGYSEHTHEVWHGTITGGVTTWDGAALATLASGVTTYTHVAPNAAQVHVYRVRAKAGALLSGYATTDPVQLLAAPNKPDVPAMPAYADKAAALNFAWVHNSVDTTPQKFYEFSTSTNGGTSWTSSGKITSAVQLRTIAASTYAANVALTTRVRTWGSATTGGADGTGASPWSDLRTVTYKTAPVATVPIPLNGSSLSDSTVRANVGFTQAEAATFVSAQLQLLQGATLLEELNSAIQVGITFATPAQNGLSYTVRARVQDSNGLWSAWASSTFSVTYLPPVPAVATVGFLRDNGFGQINLTIAAPGGGQSAATTVSITRKINGVEEAVVTDYPVSAVLTFLDTTPAINTLNVYTITTKSALGAQTTVVANLTTTELRRAYLSKGAGFSNVVVFGGNLEIDTDLGVASNTIQAAGRVKPVGLYGVETSVQVKVSSFIYEGFGSPIDQVTQILLVPGKSCYRDASGRRVFGAVKGSISSKWATRGQLSFTLTETS